MKYIDAFRNADVARGFANAMAQEVQKGRHYRLMEFCGGHTHAIFRFGIHTMVPKEIAFVHGPGCPVCVLPKSRVDYAIALLQQHRVMLCTYGDVMRVPASGGNSLLEEKAKGADVRMVYSAQDALQLARLHPEREVVFFALGFETTTPPTAVVLLQAQREGLKNFSVFCNHLLTPPAMRQVLDSNDLCIDAILGPSHVSTIIGSEAYQFCADDLKLPLVIAGFEPLDVMQSVLMLIRQLNRGDCRVENQYARAVKAEGNQKAQRMMAEVFTIRDHFEWRGLGMLPASGLQIAQRFSLWDAEKRFEVCAMEHDDEVKGCLCPSILRGVSQPQDCRLFGRGCTPEKPQGACMVSSEGACAAYWQYGMGSGALRQDAEVVL
ncbi:MAG: hydrogenase formation protein HypD [Zetaproteobacteria bacterium]|nr:hydrogenase formation protein HypD [Zetaproteobacteria bacterium]